MNRHFLSPRSVRVALGVCFGVWLAHPGALRALPEPSLMFPTASSHTQVAQQIGVTDVTIDYSRPNKKGRDVFGPLVPFDTVWRTGANACTKLSFSGPVTFGSKPVPAGRYGLFTIPGASEWTVILSKEADQWGAFEYKPADDLLRLTVRAETLVAPVETFTIGFANLQENAAQLCLEWDRIRVTVPITVSMVSKLKVGMPFPDFQVRDLDGKPLSVSAAKGKLVLVDFWATWCGPCVRELPDLRKLYDQYHAKGLEIIGVSSDDDKGRLTSFLRDKHVAWPQYFDGKGQGNQLAVPYGIDGVPTTYLVSKDGKILGKDLHGDALENAVRAALAAD